MAIQSPFHSRRTPAPDQATRDRMRAGLDQRIAESKAAGYGPSTFGDVNKELGKVSKQANQNIHANQDKGKKKKGPSLSEIKKAAKEGRTLYASQPSTCFTSVEWTDGVATLEFAHKTQMVIDIPMDLEEFLDFADAPEGMGARFNSDYYGA